MRISDWSSDVCSSDLLPEDADVRARAGVLIDHAVGIAGRRVLLPAFGEGDGKAAFHIHIVARFGGVGLLFGHCPGSGGVGGGGEFVLARAILSRFGPAAGRSEYRR